MVIKKEMILSKIGSDKILVPVGNALMEHNGMFMLTESAGFLWEKLPQCDTVQDLAQALFDEYEVTPEQALNDAQEFVNNLSQLGIIDKE